MRFRLLIAIGAVVVLFGGALPSRAACAPPMVFVDVVGARPGDTIEVTGEAWTDGCDDTPDSGGGCGSEGSAEPVTGIELRLKGPRTDQSQKALDVGEIGDTQVDVLLDTVDPDDQGSFTAEVTIPEVAPGTYFITGIAGLPAYQPPEIVIGPK